MFIFDMSIGAIRNQPTQPPKQVVKGEQPDDNFLRELMTVSSDKKEGPQVRVEFRKPNDSLYSKLNPDKDKGRDMGTA